MLKFFSQIVLYERSFYKLWKQLEFSCFHCRDQGIHAFRRCVLKDRKRLTDLGKELLVARGWVRGGWGERVIRKLRMELYTLL